MDRFIGLAPALSPTTASVFKIQYGQIYRLHGLILLLMQEDLKSNMDRFIGYR